MALRALFLDVGNTLLTERPSRFELYAREARRRGVALETERMAGLMRLAHQELPVEVDGAWRYTDRWFEAYIERIFHHHLGLPRAELAPLSRDLFANFSEPSTFVLFPGARRLLSRARELDLRLGIVSNWSPRLPPLLAALELTSAVDFVLCSAIERLEKPDPALFRRALDLAGVEAHEALHAGDDVERDVLGARRVGARAVLVDHADRRTDWDGVFGPRVTSLVELTNLVEQLAR